MLLDADDLELLGYGSPWESDYAPWATIKHERAKLSDRSRRRKTSTRAAVSQQEQREIDRARARQRRLAMGIEAAREENRRYSAAWRARHRAAPTTHTCEVCNTTWVRQPTAGPAPRYCSTRCTRRAFYLRQNPGARRYARKAVS